MRVALAAGLAATALAGAARAQDDGPRVYQLVPTGASNFTSFLVNKRGNETPEAGTIEPGANIDTDVLVARWATAMDVGGRSFVPFVIIPTGEVRRSGAPSSSGFGDAQIGATLGLTGQPALAPEAFAAFKPGFGAALFARVFLPTGAYNADKPLNLGANRFAFQGGLPMIWAWGDSYRDPRLTSLEVLPTLTVYQDNTDPYHAQRSAKARQFAVEAHLTHNLSQRVWVSLDGLYREGGKTTTDGVADQGVHGLSAGGTLTFPLTRRAAVALTYQHVVERRDDGPDGWFFRTAVIAPF